MSFLSNILGSTRHAVETRKRERPLEDIVAGIQPRSSDRIFLNALQGTGVSIIAEFKRRSPSSDVQRNAADLQGILGAYKRGGASAVSVLTEGPNFGGSLTDLRAARAACDLPILDKDFIIDEYQVYEAAEAGADAILLIVAALADEAEKLRRLHSLARELRLDVLIETRSAEELSLAMDVSSDLLGINNRNLDTFDVDVDTTLRLTEKAPPAATVVSESGLQTRRDLDRLAGCGVGAALIGSALMNDPDPEAKCRELVGAGTVGSSAAAHHALA